MNDIRKLLPRWIGPCRVINKVGTLSYRLELPEFYNQLHWLFHISKLKNYGPDSIKNQERVLPILTDKGLEYEVERIITQSRHGRTTRYLARWVGYGPEYDLQLSADDLESAPHDLAAWQARHQ